MECISSEKWFNEFGSTDNVLLINPPVQEVRYAWIKWNQPTSLLMLSSRLKEEVGCDVELLDFMLPMESGRVSIRDLAKQKIVKGTTYKTRTYGIPMEEASANLRRVLPDWKPSHIIINTLTTYWYETIWLLIPFIKTLIPGVKISVIGAYPVIETNHAKRSGADYLVSDFVDINSYIPDFELYYQMRTRLLNNGKTPLFGGLKICRGDSISKLMMQVSLLKKNNIKECVIFEGNIFENNCEVLSDFLDEVIKQDMKMNFHALCGLNISDAKDGIYKKMYSSGYRSFYLEYDLAGKELNLDSYRRMYLELKDLSISSGNLAGFIMLGTPEDDLELLFKHSFNLLEICGSIIPKPFTPNIGSDVYEEISKSGRLDYLSPHVFPLSEINGISRSEYMDFYQHTSFLNEKRLGNSFNFFDDHYCSVALKKSLGKKG